jgi:hypothetical protein
MEARGVFPKVRYRPATARRAGAVRRWIARVLCVVLLLAGAAHAGEGHADPGHADLGHAGEHEPGAAVAVADLPCLSSTADEAEAPLCAVAPGCALAAADLPPPASDVRPVAAVPPAAARLPTGLSRFPNPLPPRLPPA